MVYPVKDMARARKFYEEALGLKLTKNFKDGWIEYHLDNGCFAITTMGEDATPSANSGQIAFEVDDVDAVVNKLRDHGAAIKVEPSSGSVCRMAEVLDPEGNALCIHAKHRGR
ncbi:MAG: VOC family protein [Elusimicrobia bacterium]|nr:VOC family protein [Elusimicrobiota bacterium]